MPSQAPRFYTGTLAAGESVDINCYANVIFLLSNTGTAETLEFSFGNTQNQKIPVGLVYKDDLIFNKLTIRNGDSGSTTYKVILGVGNVDYKALVSSVTNTVTVQNAQSTTGTFAADVTAGAAAKVFSSTSTVKNVLIFSDPANSSAAANEVCIGFDNTVSATKKVIGLLPGGAYEFNNFNGDIWLFCATGSKVSVSSW